MDILLKTYRDSVAIKLPDEEEWKRMPLFQKRSVEERLQMLIKDMKNVGSIYNVNLLQLLPKHLMAEYDYPFCDIADFERQSIAAVKQFFATDAERRESYSTASTRRRRKYIEELYAAFSANNGQEYIKQTYKNYCYDEIRKTVPATHNERISGV